MKVRFFALVALLCLSTTVFAQKFKVVSGDVKALKDITSLRMEYLYSPMSVGKFDDEKDYLEKKSKEYNSKESGKGDKWKNSWIEDRNRRFEPAFEELFNKHANNTKAGNSGTYKMVMHTTFTEPGFNVHVMRKNAVINATFSIYDEQGKLIAKIEMEKAPGRTFGGYDYDTGARIEECYAMAGKALAKKYF